MSDRPKIPCPLAAHNAEVEADKRRQEELKARFATYPRVTWADLEWLEAGLESKTPAELIVWITQRILKNEMGVLDPPMDGVRMKGLQALLAKLQPDLKAIEHSGTVRTTDISDKPLSAEQWAEQHKPG